MDPVVAAMVLQLMVQLVWTCVSMAPKVQKNATYDIRMNSLEVVQKLLENTSLTFATGLYDVLQAAQPPSIDYFKSLPIITGLLWAIYVIVLEKPGRRPKLYIGSASGQERGASERMHDYDTGNAMPKFIVAALNDGYEITHKGHLCWTPVPSPSKHGSFHMVMLAIEATLSFFFWAMASRIKDYCMSTLAAGPSTPSNTTDAASTAL